MSLELLKVIIAGKRSCQSEVTEDKAEVYLATPWTAAHQAPRSMGFSRQGYWGGVPLPSLGPLEDSIYMGLVFVST